MYIAFSFIKNEDCFKHFYIQENPNLRDAMVARKSNSRKSEI